MPRGSTLSAGLGGLSVAALIALAPPTAAAVPAAATAGCKKDQVAVRLSRDRRSFPARGQGTRKVCVSIGRHGVTPKALLRAGAFGRGRRERRLMRSVRVRRLVRLAGARADRAAGAAGARASRRASRLSTTIETGPDGEHVVTELTGIIADDHESGQGQDVTVTVRKGPVRAVTRQRSSSFVDRCPDAAGDVTGEWSVGYREEVSKVHRGQRVVVRTDLSETARIEGHNGENGRLLDFSYRATGAIEVRTRVVDARTGRLVKHVPTRVYRVSLSGAGIDPRVLPDSAGQALATRKLGGRGPKGDRLTAAEVEALLSQLVSIEHAVTHRGAAALLAAEEGWYDRAECMTAQFSPATAALAPGRSADVAVAIHHVIERVEVPIQLSARAFWEGAGVSPPAAGALPGAPARFGFTAPSERWVRHRSPGFVIEGASRRGRVEQTWSASLRETAVRFRIAFEGTVDVSSSYSQDDGSAIDDTVSGRGRFKVVFPDASFALEGLNDRNRHVHQNCVAIDCNDGRFTYASHHRDDNPSARRTHDTTCRADDVSPSRRGDTTLSVGLPVQDGEPLRHGPACASPAWIPISSSVADSAAGRSPPSTARRPRRKPWRCRASC